MRHLILIGSFFALCVGLSAQNTGAVESAFQTGNAQRLAGELSDEVELNIGKDVQFVNARQAISSLDQWFSRVNPSGFSGRIAGGAAVKYYSGELKSGSGSYKVVLYFDGEDGHKIDEIRISPL